MMLKIKAILKKIIGSIFICSLVVLSSCGSKEDLPQKYINDGLAISGYDLVSYFESSAPQKGSEMFQVDYEGVKYNFSSEKNKSLFLKQPKKYLPLYGGWCGYAITRSKKMPPDPEKWVIQDGQLILFFDNIVTQITGNLQDKWESDSVVYKSKADSVWVIMDDKTK